MTEPMTLIEKLEAATEGSLRDEAVQDELNKAIVLAICPDARVAEYCVGDGYLTVFHAREIVPDKSALPNFITSVDAALTLVPVGSEYEITTIYGPARVSLPLNGGEHMDCQVVERKDGNVPLAICIAALKARGIQ